MKSKILELFFQELERELNTLVEAAFAAREAATNEEARAENKYDTRGLEASYLAGAQAKRAGELRESINQLKKIKVKDYDQNDEIESMAIVTVENEDGHKKKFFLVPIEGGSKVEHEGQIYFFVTPESPMGRSLWHQTAGHVFDFTIKGETQEFEIKSVE